MKKLILLIALLMVTSPVFAITLKQADKGKTLIVNGDRLDTMLIRNVTYSNVTHLSTIQMAGGIEMAYSTSYNDFHALKEAIAVAISTYIDGGTGTRARKPTELSDLQRQQLEQQIQQSHQVLTPEQADALYAKNHPTSKVQQQTTQVQQPITQAQQDTSDQQYYTQPVQQQNYSSQQSGQQAGQQIQQVQTNVQNGMSLLNTGLGIVRNFRSGY